MKPRNKTTKKSQLTTEPKQKGKGLNKESSPKTPDFYSSIFSEQSSEEDECHKSKAMPEKVAPKTIKVKGKSRNKILAAADSDSDDDKETKQNAGFEYEDDSDNEEPEIVGFGVKAVRNLLSKPPLFQEDLEMKQEIESEEELKPELDNEDNDDASIENDELPEDTERTAIRNDLADLTFEELMSLKEKMGLTLFNEAMFGKSGRSTTKHLSKKKQMQLMKRDNKNRPRELSSKKPVPKIREVVHVKKVVKRDPRFDDACGELDKEIWEKNYEFLKDIQKQEVQELKKSLRNVKDDDKRMEIKNYITTFKSKEKSKAIVEKEKQKMREEKEENIRRKKEGKNPFFIKKSTRKFLDLAEKYEELKTTGKLDKYLKKKRKKNVSRDKKTITSASFSGSI